MEVIHYEKDAPWVGSFECPQCKEITYAWKASGMSESCPHFYCNSCSNALVREQDKDLLYKLGVSEELLKKLIPALPDCDCGGKFEPGMNPKCPSCSFEFKHQDDPIATLGDPHVILINGAVLYRDVLNDYQIEIG